MKRKNNLKLHPKFNIKYLIVVNEIRYYITQYCRKKSSNSLYLN